MAYYLMYDAGKKNKKEVYEIIDITKAPIFTRISKSLKNQGCTIEEIDNFTLNFNNSLEIQIITIISILNNVKPFIKNKLLSE